MVLTILWSLRFRVQSSPSSLRVLVETETRSRIKGARKIPTVVQLGLHCDRGGDQKCVGRPLLSTERVLCSVTPFPDTLSVFFRSVPLLSLFGV